MFQLGQQQRLQLLPQRIPVSRHRGLSPVLGGLALVAPFKPAGQSAQQAALLRRQGLGHHGINGRQPRLRRAAGGQGATHPLAQRGNRQLHGLLARHMALPVGGNAQPGLQRRTPYGLRLACNGLGLQAAQLLAGGVLRPVAGLDHGGWCDRRRGQGAFKRGRKGDGIGPAGPLTQAIGKGPGTDMCPWPAHAGQQAYQGRTGDAGVLRHRAVSRFPARARQPSKQSMRGSTAAMAGGKLCLGRGQERKH